MGVNSFSWGFDWNLRQTAAFEDRRRSIPPSFLTTLRVHLCLCDRLRLARDDGEKPGRTFLRSIVTKSRDGDRQRLSDLVLHCIDEENSHRHAHPQRIQCIGSGFRAMFPPAGLCGSLSPPDAHSLELPAGPPRRDRTNHCPIEAVPPPSARVPTNGGVDAITQRLAIVHAANLRVCLALPLISCREGGVPELCGRKSDFSAF